MSFELRKRYEQETRNVATKLHTVFEFPYIHWLEAEVARLESLAASPDARAELMVASIDARISSGSDFCRGLSVALEIIRRHFAKPATQVAEQRIESRAEQAIERTHNMNAKPDPQAAAEPVKEANEETISYIAHEVSHDLREGRYDRIRWNNRAMMLVLNTLAKAQQAAAPPSETLWERLEALKVAARDVLDNMVLPEKNCSCHISPPCNDCVQYSGIRDSLKDMEALLAETEGKPEPSTEVLDCGCTVSRGYRCPVHGQP